MGSYYSSALCCCCVNGADAHHQLSKEHLDQLTHAFDYYDTDGSGHIGKDELAAALRSMGQSPMQSEVEHMVKEVLKTVPRLSIYPQILSRNRLEHTPPVSVSFLTAAATG